MLLGGLAAGLWPQAIYSSTTYRLRGAPLPVLQTLAAAQALFILLVHPQILSARLRRRPAQPYWLAGMIDSAVMLVVAVPFYVAGACLSDAVPRDAFRLAIDLACLWPLAWAAGAALAGGRAVSVTLISLLIASVGLPVAWYIAADFVQASRAAQWLWSLAPPTFAWDVASPRLAAWLSRPIWPALVWLIAAAMGILLSGSKADQRNPS